MRRTMVWVTFPVPETGEWQRHGHLRGILDGCQGRQPNFHKWLRPAYEQGALPTPQPPPRRSSVHVLPGEKMYQAMEIEPEFMRPVLYMASAPVPRKDCRATDRTGAIRVDAACWRTFWHGEVAAAMAAP